MRYKLPIGKSGQWHFRMICGSGRRCLVMLSVRDPDLMNKLADFYKREAASSGVYLALPAANDLRVSYFTLMLFGTILVLSSSTPLMLVTTVI